MHNIHGTITNCLCHARPKLLGKQIFLHYRMGCFYPAKGKWVPKTLRGLFFPMFKLVREEEATSHPHLVPDTRWPEEEGDNKRNVVLLYPGSPKAQPSLLGWSGTSTPPLPLALASLPLGSET